MSRSSFSWVSAGAVFGVVLNALITVFVLCSPYGVGNGSEVIGYSIIRLIICMVIQLPLFLATLGLVVAFHRQRLSWGVFLLANVCVAVATTFLYFAQGPMLAPILSFFKHKH